MLDPRAADASPWRFLRRHELSLLLAIVLVVILTAIFDSTHNYYYQPWESCKQIARQTSLLGIFSLGAAIVIIAGGIDLSAGSVICFSGTICATLLLVLAPEQMQSAGKIDLWVVATAIAGTLVVGFLIGSLHAWLITVIGLPPFIATLATLVGLRSFARAICASVTQAYLGGGGSTQIQIFDDRFRSLATQVWIPAVLFLVLALIAWLLMDKTVLGRHLYALGGNEQAARLSGIRTDRMKWFAYCASAMLSSIAGILYICDQSVASPFVLGQGYELKAIAAAVVGGCSLQGGVGTIPGTALGALFLRIVTDGISKVIKTGADIYEGLIVGIVVVFAVAFTQSKEARQRPPFFAGSIGLVAAINVALAASAMAALVGPVLLSDYNDFAANWFPAAQTTLQGSSLGLWIGCSLLAACLLTRSQLQGARRRVAAVAWALFVIGLFFALDRGLPAYRIYAAESEIRSAGGTMMRAANGEWTVDLSGSNVDDRRLKRIIARLYDVPNVVDLSVARTEVTDEGIVAIKGLPQLKRLEVKQSQISANGRSVLRRSLPDVNVVD